MPEMPLRVVTYSRVSTEDQADYGTGLDTQDIENVRFAERIGAVVVGRESDPGVSGTIYPRAGLERALRLLESGQADALIVHRVDRLGREQWIPPFVHKRIKVAQARLFTVEDGEVTDQNILLFALRGGMAQADYSRLIQNLRAGQRRLAEKGQTPSRAWSPYGYHIVQKVEQGQVRENAGAFVIVEAEAEVVRLIYTRYEAGDSLSAICRLLHTQGVPIPRPERQQVTRSFWQATMVSRILKNTAYKGYIMWGKTRAVFKDKADLSFEERLNCRTQNPRKRVDTPTPESAQVRIPVPPLVSVALWEACQKRRQENKEAGGVRNDRKHLFASLVRCPSCNRRMNSGRVHYKKRATEDRPVFYRCHDYAPSQTAPDFVCHRTHYKEQDIRAAVRRFFVALTETPEFVAAAFQAYADSRQSNYSADEHAQVINDLRELDAKEAATAQAYSNSIRIGTRPEVFEAQLTEIVQERRRLEARKGAMETLLMSHKDEDAQEVAQIVAAYARDILEVLDSDTLETVEQNQALRRVLHSIKPIPDGFRVEAYPIATTSSGQVDIQLPPVTSIVTPVK